MTVRLQDGQIVLEGRCRVEDAEALLDALLQQPDCVVQLAGAETIHSAIIQILLAVRPRISGTSKHDFLQQFRVLDRARTGRSSDAAGRGSNSVEYEP